MGNGFTQTRVVIRSDQNHGQTCRAHEPALPAAATSTHPPSRADRSAAEITCSARRPSLKSGVQGAPARADWTNCSSAVRYDGSPPGAPIFEKIAPGRHKNDSAFETCRARARGLSRGMISQAVDRY